MEGGSSPPHPDLANCVPLGPLWADPRLGAWVSRTLSFSAMQHTCPHLPSPCAAHSVSPHRSRFPPGPSKDIKSPLSTLSPIVCTKQYLLGGFYVWALGAGPGPALLTWCETQAQANPGHGITSGSDVRPRDLPEGKATS